MLLWVIISLAALVSGPSRAQTLIDKAARDDTARVVRGDPSGDASGEVDRRWRVCGRRMQFGAQLLRQRGLRAAFQIGRRVLWIEIAPALKGPAGAGMNRDHFGFQNQMAARNALFVDKGSDVEQGLARGYLPFDHPIERAARK